MQVLIHLAGLIIAIQAAEPSLYFIGLVPFWGRAYPWAKTVLLLRLLMKARLGLGLFCFIAVTLAACSRSTSHTPDKNLWMLDGMIAVSRPVPATSSIENAVMMGFMPLTQAAHAGPWILIDKGTQLVTLMDGDKEVGMAPGEGFSSLKSGSYQVMHKQRNALWYAPDNYFLSRNLRIPPQGDRSRYLRGALGDFVVFINKDTPIFSGPFWTEDIGGIRLNEDDMSRLYYKIDVGAPIEVR
ncbi:MAG: L,D-transpeptidase [Oligoflexia bacterium]|nr:L,D-transpeptidase [Oligoflexia bacterium]